MRKILATATMDAGGFYRYRLDLRWGDSWTLPCAILLNPGAGAPSARGDTIRVLRALLTEAGFDGVMLVNLFGMRAATPGGLRAVADPIGEDNDRILCETAETAWMNGMPVLCAWGDGGTYLGRAAQIVEYLGDADPLLCLGLTKSGNPLHPRALALRPREFAAPRFLPYDPRSGSSVSPHRSQQ